MFFAEVAQQLLMYGVCLHDILLHEHHCAKCCIMREPLLELIWYLENFIQRLIRYLLSRHPRKTETRTKVQAFKKTQAAYLNAIRYAKQGQARKIAGWMPWH